ncbi:MAG: DUF4912 domain-containing protein [Pirellulaceae bacterium]|nr:DUF4912 domain-containing protein [Pirellulaceae bacterium]
MLRFWVLGRGWQKLRFRTYPQRARIPQIFGRGRTLVTLANLRAQTSKDLAQLARSSGVAGWSSMRKEQLVKALLKVLKKRETAIAKAENKSLPKTNESKSGSKPAKTAVGNKPAPKHSAPNLEIERSAIAAKLEREAVERERLKNLALTASLAKDEKRVEKDRLILIVRDSFWLQAYWEITPTTVSRAKTSLEKNWRGAKPVLRLYEIVEENDSHSEKLAREIPIHSGVDTWYIDTLCPPKTYRAAIGYVTETGRFFSLCKSNRVSTPSTSVKTPSSHWADIAADCENVFAMSGGYDPLSETKDLREVFEEKLQRPMIALGPNHAALLDQNLDFPFEVDAQMVIYGMASPGSSVTLAGEPVKVDPDGNFSIRLDFPDKRQVLPVVACSRDGSQQRTTVLAIERNTKVMEAINIDADEM